MCGGDGVKITVQEDEQQLEIEVVIHCRNTDEQVEKIVALLSSFDKKLVGIQAGQNFMIDPLDVLYFDSVDKKTFVYTTEDVFEILLRLYELDERLPQNFFRASKSAIININKIISIRPDFGSRLEVTLVSGERLTVSRQYAQDLKAKLQI